MRQLCLILLSLISTLLIIPARAEEGTPVDASLLYPALSGPLKANSNPFNIEAGPLGPIYVTGVVSGLGLLQDHPVSGNGHSFLDLNNAQLFVQNIQGFFQFYVQTGGYSFPALGVPYLRMSDTTNDFFGPVPVGFIKLAPSDHFSLMVGKLQALMGNENTFTFQNANIQTGLLGNQTNGVNRSVQMNLAQGQFSGSLALSDGFYSNKFTWLSALLNFTINAHHKLTASASGNLGHDAQSSLATPLAQNNSQVYDLIYSYTHDSWTISPTLQYTYVPEDADIGLTNSASTYGAALLIQYILNPEWGFAGRVEYIDTTGGTNVAYGPGSDAWSLTLTPSYQHKLFFARGEASLVSAAHITPGSGFGANGDGKSQARLLIETGILF